MALVGLASSSPQSLVRQTPSLKSLVRAYHPRLHARKQAAGHQPIDDFRPLPLLSTAMRLEGKRRKGWLPTAQRLTCAYLYNGSAWSGPVHAVPGLSTASHSEGENKTKYDATTGKRSTHKQLLRLPDGGAPRLRTSDSWVRERGWWPWLANLAGGPGENERVLVCSL